MKSWGRGVDGTPQVGSSVGTECRGSRQNPFRQRKRFTHQYKGHWNPRDPSGDTWGLRYGVTSVRDSPSRVGPTVVPLRSSCGRGKKEEVRVGQSHPRDRMTPVRDYTRDRFPDTHGHSDTHDSGWGRHRSKLFPA